MLTALWMGDRRISSSSQMQRLDEAVRPSRGARGTRWTHGVRGAPPRAHQAGGGGGGPLLQTSGALRMAKRRGPAGSRQPPRATLTRQPHAMRTSSRRMRAGHQEGAEEVKESSTAVCGLVCARKTAKSSTSSTLFMDTNRRASPKVDRHNLHFGAAHHDTDYGAPCAALGAFLLGRAGKLSSIRSSVPLF